MLWHNKEDDRMISKVPQGKGKNHLMDPILKEKVNKFCMLNHPSMEKYVTIHELDELTILYGDTIKVFRGHAIE